MIRSLFGKRFGRNPVDFSSIEEVNMFVEEKIGRKLKIERLYPNLVSTRSCVLPIKNVSADEVIDNALNNND